MWFSKGPKKIKVSTGNFRFRHGDGEWEGNILVLQKEIKVFPETPGVPSYIEWEDAGVEDLVQFKLKDIPTFLKNSVDDTKKTV